MYAFSIRARPGLTALQNYSDYSTRYQLLGCAQQHNTQFFTDCCHPLLVSVSADAARQLLPPPLLYSLSVIPIIEGTDASGGPQAVLHPADLSG